MMLVASALGVSQLAMSRFVILATSSTYNTWSESALDLKVCDTRLIMTGLNIGSQ